MKWFEFKNLLKENMENHLQVQYDIGKFIDSSYHITEIKFAKIDSVDCGGNVDSWDETILQFVEYENENKSNPMLVSKSLSIINLVESKIKIDKNSIVKFEFGNSKNRVSHYIPTSHINSSNELIINLISDTTGCKPALKGETCGPKNYSVSSKEEIWNGNVKTGCCQSSSSSY